MGSTVVRVSRASLAAVAAVMLLGGVPSTAAASTVVGSGLGVSPDGSIVCSDPDGCMLAQTVLHGHDVVTGDGVITRWRASFPASIASQQVALAVLRREGVGYTLISMSDWVTVPAGETSLAAETSLLPRPGDHIAVALREDGVVGTATGPTADGTIARFMPLLSQFGPRAPSVVETTDQEILLNAEVEPDLDGDGRGDETRDNCPESPDSSDRPCSIDVVVEAPAQSRVFVGFWGALQVRLLWRRDPELPNWLSAGTLLTVEAPPHAPILSADTGGSPCQEVTRQRAVCLVRMPPQILGVPWVDHVTIRTLVDPWTVPPSLARSGAPFTASIAPTGRDADTQNNRVSWTLETAAPRCFLPLRGKRRAERIAGSDYGDRITGAGGNDVLIGNGGRDCLDGGRGNDRLVANDGRRDKLDCGPGRRDRAVLDRLDRRTGCEIVRRRRAAR
jgi:hypothetical protein